MKVHYSHNNSGGGWWLTDKDWIALEDNGWKVAWFRNDPPMLADGDGRFLGAPAREATKDFDTVGEAIHDWQKITGLDASDDGCDCCGPPHAFW